MALKQTLEPREVICMAYGHYILGLEKQALSMLLGVNPGRVSEACQVAWDSAERFRELYSELRQRRGEPPEDPNQDPHA